MKDKRIILIGAGNVAHHLAPALLKAGLNLCQIYSRSIESARELGRKTGITYTADLFGIYPDGDIYIFCVSDDALLSLFKSIRINKEAIILHTSGSLPMDIFKPYVTYYGVLYPLQTFTKKRDLDFKEIPLCIEASNPEVLEVLRGLTRLLSVRVEEISSEKRKTLHLAAVFANNFVNHLYGIAGQILEQEGLDFSLLRPLIFETAHKVMLITPETSEERIREIDNHTEGFIYMVSSAAITGAQKDFNEQKQAYFKRIEAMQLKNPRMIGFGISNRQTYEAAASHAAGCIIGSKFVTLLKEENGDAAKAVDRLQEALRQ